MSQRRVTTLELNMTSKNAKQFLEMLKSQASAANEQVNNINLQMNKLVQQSGLSKQKLAKFVDPNQEVVIDGVTHKMIELADKYRTLAVQLKEQQKLFTMYDGATKGVVKEFSLLSRAAHDAANMTQTELNGALKEYQKLLGNIGRSGNFTRDSAELIKHAHTLQTIKSRMAEIKNGALDAFNTARKALENFNKPMAGADIFRIMQENASKVVSTTKELINWRNKITLVDVGKTGNAKTQSERYYEALKSAIKGVVNEVDRWQEREQQHGAGNGGNKPVQWKIDQYQQLKATLEALDKETPKTMQNIAGIDKVIKQAADSSAAYAKRTDNFHDVAQKWESLNSMFQNKAYASGKNTAQAFSDSLKSTIRKELDRIGSMFSGYKGTASLFDKSFTDTNTSKMRGLTKEVETYIKTVEGGKDMLTQWNKINAMQTQAANDGPASAIRGLKGMIENLIHTLPEGSAQAKKFKETLADIKAGNTAQNVRHLDDAFKTLIADLPGDNAELRKLQGILNDVKAGKAANSIKGLSEVLRQNMIEVVGGVQNYTNLMDIYKQLQKGTPIDKIQGLTDTMRDQIAVLENEDKFFNHFNELMQVAANGQFPNARLRELSDVLVELMGRVKSGTPEFERLVNLTRTTFYASMPIDQVRGLIATLKEQQEVIANTEGTTSQTYRNMGEIIKNYELIVQQQLQAGAVDFTKLGEAGTSALEKVRKELLAVKQDGTADQEVLKQTTERLKGVDDELIGRYSKIALNPFAYLPQQVQQAISGLKQVESELDREDSRRKQINATIQEGTRLQQQMANGEAFERMNQALKGYGFTKVYQELEQSNARYAQSLQDAANRVDTLRNRLELAKQAEQQLVQERLNAAATGGSQGLQAFDDSAQGAALRRLQGYQTASGEQVQGTVARLQSALDQATMSQDKFGNAIQANKAKMDQMNASYQNYESLTKMTDAELKNQEQIWQKQADALSKDASKAKEYQIALQNLAAVQQQQRTNSMNTLGLSQVGNTLQTTGTGMLAQLNDQAFPKTEEWLKKLEQELTTFKTKMADPKDAQGMRLLSNYLANVKNQLDVTTNGAMTFAEAEEKMKMLLDNMSNGKTPFVGTKLQIEQVTQGLQKLRAEYVRTSNQTGVQNVDRAMKGLKQSIDTDIMSVKEFNQILAKPKSTRDIEKLNYVLGVVRERAKAAGMATMEQANQMRALDKQIKTVNQSMGYHASTLESAMSRLKSYVMIYMGFNALMMKARQLISSNFELSDSMAKIQKVSGLTSNEVKLLTNSIEQLDTRIGQSDLLKYAYQGSKLGLATEGGLAALSSFSEAAAKVNSALGEDFGGDQAIGNLTKLTQVMHVAEEQGVNVGTALEKAASSILVLGNTSTANYSYIEQFSSRVAGIARAADIALPDLMAIGSTLDTMKMPAEMAATAMTKFIATLSKKPEGIEKAIGLDKGTLSDMTEAHNTMGALVKVFQTLHEKKADLKDMANVLKDLVGGGNNTRALQVITSMANGYETLTQHIERSNQAFEEGSAIQREYDIMNETTAAYAKRAGNAIAEMFVNAGNSDGIKTAFKAIAQYFEYMEKHVGEFIGQLAGIFAFIYLRRNKLSLSISELFLRTDANISKVQVHYDAATNKAVASTKRVQVAAQQATQTATAGVERLEIEVDKAGNKGVLSVKKQDVAVKEHQNVWQMLYAKLQALRQKNNANIVAEYRKLNMLAQGHADKQTKAAMLTFSKWSGTFASIRMAAMTCFNAINAFAKQMVLFVVIDEITSYIGKLYDAGAEAKHVSEVIGEANSDLIMSNFGVNDSFKANMQRLKQYQKDLSDAGVATQDFKLNLSTKELAKLNKEWDKNHEAMVHNAAQAKINRDVRKEDAAAFAEQKEKLKAEEVQLVKNSDKTQQLTKDQKQLNETINKYNLTHKGILNMLTSRFEIEDLIDNKIIDRKGHILQEAKALQMVAEYEDKINKHRLGTELIQEEKKSKIAGISENVNMLRTVMSNAYKSLDKSQRDAFDKSGMSIEGSLGNFMSKATSLVADERNSGGVQKEYDEMVKTAKTLYNQTGWASTIWDNSLRKRMSESLKFIGDSFNNVKSYRAAFPTLDVPLPTGNDGSEGAGFDKLGSGSGSGSNKNDISPKIAQEIRNAIKDAKDAVTAMYNDRLAQLNLEYRNATPEEKGLLDIAKGNIAKEMEDTLSLVERYMNGDPGVASNPLLKVLTDQMQAQYALDAKGDKEQLTALNNLKENRRNAISNADRALNGRNDWKTLDIELKKDKKGNIKEYVDMKNLKKLIGEIDEELDKAVAESLRKHAQSIADRRKEILDEMIKSLPFEELKAQMAENMNKLDLFNTVDTAQLKDRMNEMFDIIREASKRGADSISEILKDHNIADAWKIPADGQKEWMELMVTRVEDFANKYADTIRQQAQKIQKRMEAAWKLDGKDNAIEQMQARARISGQVAGQYQGRMNELQAQISGYQEDANHWQGVLNQRGKTASGLVISNETRNQLQARVDTLTARANELGKGGQSSPELTDTLLQLEEAKADLADVAMNLQEVNASTNGLWDKYQQNMDDALAKRKAAEEELAALQKSMAEDLMKRLQDYDTQQANAMSWDEYKQRQSTLNDTKKSHYSRQESAGFGGNTLGLTNSDVQNFRFQQEKIFETEREMTEIEFRRDKAMKDAMASGKEGVELQNELSRITDEYEINRVAKQKELNELMREDGELREEMAIKIYEHMQQYGEVVNTFTRSLAEAGSKTAADNNIALAKARYTDAHTTGSASQKYVIYKGDGSTEEVSMNEEQRVKREQEIEAKNARIESINKALNDWGEKMAQDITDAFQVRINEKQEEKNEEIQTEQEILDAAKQRLESEKIGEQSFTEEFQRQLGVRMEAFVNYVDVLKSKAEELAGGSQSAGNDIQNAAAGVASAVGDAASSALSTVGSSASISIGKGSSTSYQNSDGTWSNGLSVPDGDIASDDNTFNLDSLNLESYQDLANKKIAIEQNMNDQITQIHADAASNQLGITQSTAKGESKAMKATAASMIQSMNMYGATYSAVMNDNLDASQKTQMVMLQLAGQTVMQMISLAGTEAISKLTVTQAQTTGEVTANQTVGISNLFKNHNFWVAMGLTAALTALLGAGMALASSKIGKAKSEIAQVTGASAGKLSTGMLTYATGRYLDDDDDLNFKARQGMLSFADGQTYAEGASYSVDGADGKSYNAKYAGSVSSMGTGIKRGTHFGIFSEVKPEMVVDGDTTALMHNKYPMLENAIMTLSRTGSLNMPEMLGLNYGNISKTINTLTKSHAISFSGGGFKMPTFAEGDYPYDSSEFSVDGLEQSGSEGLSRGTSQMQQLNDTLALLQATLAGGINATMTSKSYAKTKRFETRNHIKGGLNA